MTIQDVKKLWLLVLSRDYSTTEAPIAWKAFIKRCKAEHKSLDEVYASLKATYDYRQTWRLGKMNKLYFNNANGSEYEVLEKYFDEVMLLKTENNYYIVARWIKGNEWGSGHYWMNNKEGAYNDFYQIVTDTLNERMEGRNYITINKVKELYKEV